MNPIPPVAEAAPVRRWNGWLAVLLAGLALQAPLWLNPGYFSHDELQWAAFADVADWRRLPWSAWFDTSVFQYRPLTFNLWLLLSHGLADHPRAFHFVFVLLGTLNALLLRATVLRASGRADLAAAAALAFLLSPYVAYVHGWVGTLGDLLWVGCGLGLAWLGLARADWHPVRLVALAMTLTSAALLAKEAAIVLPALALLAWLLGGRKRTWLWIALGALLPTLAYLGLRLDVVLFAPRQTSTYVWGITELPLRWFEYVVFPYAATVFEVFGLATNASARRLALVALAAFVLHAGLWRCSPRLALGFVLAGAAALGPVLILNGAASQYGYGYSAVSAGLLALAWGRADRAARLALGLPLLLVLLHGAFVQWRMLEVGRAHADLVPHLLAELRSDPRRELRLYPVRQRLHFAYQRLTHQVPRLQGVAMGDRVRVVDDPALATHRIEADGRLTPLTP